MSQLAGGTTEKTSKRQNWTEITPQALYDKCLTLAKNLWWSWHPGSLSICFATWTRSSGRKIDHNPDRAAGGDDARAAGRAGGGKKEMVL